MRFIENPLDSGESVLSFSKTASGFVQCLVSAVSVLKFGNGCIFHMLWCSESILDGKSMGLFPYMAQV